MTQKKEVRCKLCDNERPKRRIIKRNPIKDITDESILFQHGYKEFVCENEIEVLTKAGTTASGKPLYKWVKETCNNHMLRDPRKYALKN